MAIKWVDHDLSPHFPFPAAKPVPLPSFSDALYLRYTLPLNPKPYPPPPGSGLSSAYPHTEPLILLLVICLLSACLSLILCSSRAVLP